MQHIVISLAHVHLLGEVSPDYGTAVSVSAADSALVLGGIGVNNPIAAYPTADTADAHVVRTQIARRPVGCRVTERNDDGILGVGAVQFAGFV